MAQRGPSDGSARPRRPSRRPEPVEGRAPHCPLPSPVAQTEHMLYTLPSTPADERRSLCSGAAKLSHDVLLLSEKVRGGGPSVPRRSYAGRGPRRGRRARSACPPQRRRWVAWCHSPLPALRDATRCSAGPRPCRCGSRPRHTHPPQNNRRRTHLRKDGPASTGPSVDPCGIQAGKNNQPSKQSPFSALFSFTNRKKIVFSII